MIKKLLQLFSIFKRNKSKSTFHVFKDKSKEWRFNLKAPNHEIIAQSEGYSSKQGCLNGVEAVKKYARNASITISDNKRG